LRDAGYATACYGTWHISAEFWDRGVETGNQDANCERAAANAIQYLRERPADQPFFLMVGFAQPHRPYTDTWPDPQRPDEVVVPGYLDDTARIRREMVNFYGGVSEMDAAAGRVLDALHERGLDEDTLVVFTSDHGIGMPLAKGTLYDPGCKIPLIIRWVGHIAGARRYGRLTANTDLLPTVLEAVGEVGRIPQNLDGHSLWPFAAGDEQDVSHQHVFLEQTWHDFYEPIRAVRTAQHKLIRNFEPGTGLQVAADILYTPTVDEMRDTLRDWPRPPFELYDLERDPLERDNLIGRTESQEVEAALRQKLENWLSRTGDPIVDGVVPAPVGYWEHFCAKPVGPGGLPPEKGRDEWLTVRWPSGATEHRCKLT
jgi:arylsulfatase A-like enzyme